MTHKSDVLLQAIVFFNDAQRFSNRHMRPPRMNVCRLCLFDVISIYYSESSTSLDLIVFDFLPYIFL